MGAVRLTFFATLMLRRTTERVARSTDTVGTLRLTAVLGVRADVMVQPVVRGATLERQLQLQRHLEPKSRCWAHLRLHLRMVVIPPMVLVGLGMATPFVVIGQTALVVLFTGYSPLNIVYMLPC